MSANNQLTIHKKDNKYILKNVDMDTGKGFVEGKFSTLKEARDKAKEIMRSEEVEYGLKISEEILDEIN